jgi:protein SCO1/2
MIGNRLLIGVLWMLLSASAVLAATVVPESRSPDSLYQLKIDLTTQAGTHVGFDLQQGHPVLVSMFYGGCPAACPMLITSLQVYESHLDLAARDRLRVLLVSFDPERDSPSKLEDLIRLHRIDTTRWALASAPAADARKLAALLGFQYRRNDDGSYDHSLLITLLDGDGRVLAKTSKLVGDDAFQARLEAATARASSLARSPAGATP